MMILALFPAVVFRRVVPAMDARRRVVTKC
jgi:hypothetical protein